MVLIEHCSALKRGRSCVLIGEGLGEIGRTVLPLGIAADQAELRIIVDRIDGTCGLMCQKRPAWILAGVALNHGSLTS
jgi:hypothetical protein